MPRNPTPAQVEASKRNGRMSRDKKKSAESRQKSAQGSRQHGLRAKTIGLETRLIHVDEECSRQRAIADELRTSLKVSRNVVRAKYEMIASLERKIGPKDREIERTRDQHAKAIGDLGQAHAVGAVAAS